MATMAPERSRTLHNFSLPPRLNWGTQKLLRCANVTDNATTNITSNNNRKRRSSSSSSQIDAIREKLILDLRSQVDKMRSAFLHNPQFAPDLLPRNSRPRRPEFAAPASFCGDGDSDGVERAKFKVELLREEVEDDFFKMTGRRPPRKPKKRPRFVQKQLDTLFPGVWLSEITADMYKVSDNPESAK